MLGNFFCLLRNPKKLPSISDDVAKTLIFFLAFDGNPNLFASWESNKNSNSNSDDVTMTWQFKNLKGSLRNFIQILNSNSDYV